MQVGFQSSIPIMTHHKLPQDASTNIYIPCYGGREKNKHGRDFDETKDAPELKPKTKRGLHDAGFNLSTSLEGKRRNHKNLKSHIVHFATEQGGITNRKD